VRPPPRCRCSTPDWHQGVVGIVAARIKERLHRPVFAFARGDAGEIKGSGRSIPGLHLRDALDLVCKRAPGLLLRFGGHAMAAGLTLRESDFARFRELFAQVADELLAPADRTRTLETDGGLESAYFSIATARLLEAEVWGQGFPAPLFQDEFAVESQRILKDKHLKLRLRKGMQQLDAIQFNFQHGAGQPYPGRLPTGDQRLQRRSDAAVDGRAHRESIGVRDHRPIAVAPPTRPNRYFPRSATGRR
jgi:single-stranded-DNA-specific exonuclease